MAQSPLPANGLRYWRQGRRGQCSGAENCLKMLQNPRRPVQAMLGHIVARGKLPPARRHNTQSYRPPQ
jgi:hypothetical protein